MKPFGSVRVLLQSPNCDRHPGGFSSAAVENYFRKANLLNRTALIATRFSSVAEMEDGEEIGPPAHARGHQPTQTNKREHEHTHRSNPPSHLRKTKTKRKEREYNTGLKRGRIKQQQRNLFLPPPFLLPLSGCPGSTTRTAPSVRAPAVTDGNYAITLQGNWPAAESAFYRRGFRMKTPRRDPDTPRRFM